MQLYPYEGLEVENKKIMFGLTPDEVTALLGRPENDTNNRAQYNDSKAHDFYEETRGSFKFFYEEDKLVLIQVSDGQDVFSEQALCGSTNYFSYIRVRLFPALGMSNTDKGYFLYEKGLFEYAKKMYEVLNCLHSRA